MTLQTMGQRYSRVAGSVLGITTGKRAFHVAAACYIVLIIGWLIVLTATEGGWHEGHTFIWNFKISLNDFSVNRNWSAPKARQHHEITKLSQQLDAMKMMKPIKLDVVRYQFCQGHYADFKDSWDVASDPWCNFLRRLQLSSLLLFVCSAIGLICMVLGVMACFSFHYVKARDDHHMWATAYLLMSPLLFSLGVSQYYIHTKDFGALIDESVNIGFFSTGTFGAEFAWAVVLSISSWIPAWLMIGFSFRTTIFQDSDEEGKDLWGFISESEADYGGVQSSGQPSSAGSSDAARNNEDPEGQTGLSPAPSWHGGQWQRPSQVLQAVRQSLANAMGAGAADPLPLPTQVPAQVLVRESISSPSPGAADQSDPAGSIPWPQLVASNLPNFEKDNPAASAIAPMLSQAVASSAQSDPVASAIAPILPQAVASSAQSDLADTANAPGLLQAVASSAPSDLVDSAEAPG